MEDTSNLSWIDSYNTSWTREDLYLILSYGGTQYLYEKLVSNGEIENSVNLSNRQNQTIKPTRKASRYEKICAQIVIKTCDFLCLYFGNIGESKNIIFMCLSINVSMYSKGYRFVGKL